jgi:hypothetical protein
MEQPKLPAVVRSRIRLKHLSKRTEEAYVYWIIRFILCVIVCPQKRSFRSEFLQKGCVDSPSVIP